MKELELLEEADRRARNYVAGVNTMRVFADADALAGLERFNERLPESTTSDSATLKLLDEAGSPATVVSNGPPVVWSNRVAGARGVSAFCFLVAYA